MNSKWKTPTAIVIKMDAEAKSYNDGMDENPYYNARDAVRPQARTRGSLPVAGR
jgi:hypothetical protein